MPKRKNTFLGLRKSAIGETLLFLSISVILSYMFGDGTRYINVSPHPFWIIVLLIVSQYGTNEGLMSAALAGAFLLVGNMPEQQLTEDLYEHLLTSYYRPIMWFIAAVILGQLRTRHIAERKDMQSRLKLLSRRESAITKAYINARELKETLETRLAGQRHLRSSITAYNAIKSIETLSQSRVLLGVEEVVNSVLSPEKFSVYALGSTGFEAATCSGWDDNETYTRRFGNESKLYHEIVGKKKMLCSVNKDDEKILDGAGILAAPLMDATNGVIFGMLKIEKMDFMELTINNIETFKILCEWIGMAYTNAGKYQEAARTSMLAPNGLFSYNLFVEENSLFDSIPIIKCTPIDKEDDIIAAVLHNAVKRELPKTARLFNGERSDFLILIPALTDSQATEFLETMQKNVPECTFEIEVLLQ